MCVCVVCDVFVLFVFKHKDREQRLLKNDVLHVYYRAGVTLTGLVVLSAETTFVLPDPHDCWGHIPLRLPDS